MSLRQHDDARVIAARKGLIEQIRQIWTYRQLLVRMVRKELQVKYKNSVLGFFWSMLNPALYLAVFYVVFQLIMEAGIPDFAIYLLSGLLAWNLFATSLGAATASITINASLVQKVYFPREVLPLASVGAGLVHFFLQAIVLLGFLVAFRYEVSLSHSVAIIPALAILVLLSAGLALFLGAANVYLRDVEHLVELALLAWFWLTPIVYPYKLVADRLSSAGLSGLQWLNPIVPITLTFQRGIYNVVEVVGGEPSDRPLGGGPGADGVTGILPADMDVMWYLTHLGPIAVIAVVLGVVGLVFFGRAEGNLAEEL